MSAWPQVKLASVAEIERDGIAPDHIQTGTRYLGLEHIESGGRIISNAAVDAGDLASTKFQFSDRHVLYGKLRPYLAKIALPNFDGICSTDIVPIRPTEKLDRKFLAYFLRQPSMVEFANSRATGANLPRLSPKALAEFEIPLPPLDQQRRIAAILDQADELRRKRQRSIDRLNQLGQAIFHEMFGDPVMNEFGWPKSPIKNADIKIADGNYSSKYPTREDFVETGVPFIRANNMKGGSVINDDMRYISRRKHEELKKGHLKTGDILITTRGQIGNVSLVPKCHENSNINAQIVLLRPNIKKIESSFLFGLLSTKSMQRIFEDLQTGVALKQLPVGKLKDVEIIVPPLERQVEFAATNRVLAEMQAQAIVSMERANMLFSSLQHRAFQGGL